MDEFGKMTMEEFAENVRQNIKIINENTHPAFRCFLEAREEYYNNRMRSTLKYKILNYLYTNSSYFRKYVREFIF
jgi:hypothetical protein